MGVAARSGPATAYVPRRPERTLLHEVVARELPAFVGRAHEHGRRIPPFVERTFRDYLACGDPARGFVRLRCRRCGCERALAFSCKRRGVCPSCNGRRMADVAADLVDFVLPTVAVRQWVLTLPFSLRYRLAYDRTLIGPVLGAFVRALFRSIRRRVRDRYGVGDARCGAVTFVQRFGGALNLNVHFHTLALEGAYKVWPAEGRLRWLPLPAPTDGDVREVLADSALRIARQLRRAGIVGVDDGTDPDDPLSSGDPLLATLYAAAVQGRTALGAGAGQATPRLASGGFRRPAAKPAVPLCAVGHGMSLHAAVRVAASDRRRLERVCRYTARPPLALERLSRTGQGRLAYEMRHPWRDGTTHVVFDGAELLARLAALIPPPRQHQVRYHGILAPAAAWRDRVVPGRPARAGDAEVSAERGPTNRRGRRRWAELLRRIFAVDASLCPRCHTPMQQIAAIVTERVAAKILANLGANERAPPRAAPA